MNPTKKELHDLVDALPSEKFRVARRLLKALAEEEAPSGFREYAGEDIREFIEQDRITPEIADKIERLREPLRGVWHWGMLPRALDRRGAADRICTASTTRQRPIEEAVQSAGRSSMNVITQARPALTRRTSQSVESPS